jgi:hypothetical protein
MSSELQQNASRINGAESHGAPSPETRPLPQQPHQKLSQSFSGIPGSVTLALDIAAQEHER